VFFAGEERDHKEIGKNKSKARIIIVYASTFDERSELCFKRFNCLECNLPFLSRNLFIS